LLCSWNPREPVATVGWLFLISFCAVLKWFFEVGPGFVFFWFAVPFSDVACKDGGSGDDDETDVDELGYGFCNFSGFCLVGVVVDGSAYVHNGPGMVVGFCFHFGFCGGKGMMSDGSVGVKESMHDLRERSFEESGFVVNFDWRGSLCR
jgi:hypothetical protein